VIKWASCGIVQVRPEVLSVGVLVGDDMDVDGGGVAQEAMNCPEVKKFTQTFHVGATKNHLGDMFLARECRHRERDVFSFYSHDFRTQVAGEANVSFQRLMTGALIFRAGVHVDDVQLGIQRSSIGRKGLS